MTTKNRKSKTACCLSNGDADNRARIVQLPKNVATLRLAQKERSDEELDVMRASASHNVEDLLDYLLPNYTNLIARG